jgi:exosortase
MGAPTARLTAAVPAAYPQTLVLSLAGAAVGMLLLYAGTTSTLVREWWSDPTVGHGLLLVPIAVVLAYRAGISSDAAGRQLQGAMLLALAVAMRHVASVATASLIGTRLSLLLALVALTVFYAGWPQLRRWWLSFTLVALAIPLPGALYASLTLSLQLQASKIGAALLAARDIPVLLTGNVLRLPNRELFVTEACSGLRSLTALVSLAVLCGALRLRWPASRLLLVALAVPIAILINGVRVFLVGFLVAFVSPAAAEGFLHISEGWLMFVVAFGLLFTAALIVSAVESRLSQRAVDA